jgi:hypothetical protein
LTTGATPGTRSGSGVNFNPVKTGFLEFILRLDFLAGTSGGAFGWPMADSPRLIKGFDFFGQINKYL